MLARHNDLWRHADTSQLVTLCDTNWDPPQVIVISVIVMFYVPLAAIFVLFARIICVLRRHMTAFTVRMRTTTSFYEPDVSTSDITSTVVFEQRLSPNSPRSHGSKQMTSSGLLATPVGRVTNRSTETRMYGSRDQPTRMTSCIEVGVIADRKSLSSSDVSTAASRIEMGAIPVCSWAHQTRGASLTVVEPPKWRQYASQLRARRQDTMQEARLRQQVKVAKTFGAITGFLLPSTRSSYTCILLLVLVPATMLATVHCDAGKQCVLR